MGRNFGLGQRDMGRAGKVALQSGVGSGDISFWGRFRKRKIKHGSPKKGGGTSSNRGKGWGNKMTGFPKFHWGIRSQSEQPKWS